MNHFADVAKTNPIKPNFKPFTYKKLTKNPYFDKSRLSTNVNKSNNIGGIVDSDNVLLDEQLDTDGDTLSSVVKGEKNNGRYRNRTCDPLIKSQLLYRLS